jgi:hypothetical protein
VNDRQSTGSEHCPDENAHSGLNRDREDSMKKLTKDLGAEGPRARPISSTPDSRHQFTRGRREGQAAGSEFSEVQIDKSQWLAHFAASFLASSSGRARTCTQHDRLRVTFLVSKIP